MFGVLKCTFLKVSIILPKFSFNFVVVKLLVTMSVHLDYRGFRNVLIIRPVEKKKYTKFTGTSSC